MSGRVGKVNGEGSLRDPLMESIGASKPVISWLILTTPNSRGPGDLMPISRSEISIEIEVMDSFSRNGGGNLGVTCARMMLMFRALREERRWSGRVDDTSAIVISMSLGRVIWSRAQEGSREGPACKRLRQSSTRLRAQDMLRFGAWMFKISSGTPRWRLSNNKSQGS